MIKRSSCFLFLLCVCAVLFAQSSLTASDMLQKQLSYFHSMTADFSQVVLSVDGTPLQKSTGTMAIARPGKFRWETTMPMNQQIITNGQTVWIYDPMLKQVVERPLNQSISQTPILLLTQAHVYLQNTFNIVQLRQKQAGQWFELTPKEQGEMFSRIVLGFQHNKILQMQFSNQLGQQTLVKFSNVKMNDAVPASKFIFKAPQGVDVVKS